MSQLSKLSLSKSKAAKRQQESTPSNVVRQAAATVVASQPLHCAPQVNGQQRPPTARSVPRLLDSDDSDWESEPSQPACEAPVHVLPAAAAAAAAAALAPARPQEPGAGAAASTAPGAAPLVGLCGRTTLPLAIGSGGAAHSAAGEPAAQPRLSEVYDLNCSSDEEFQHPPRRPPGSSAPALAASGSKADRVAGVGTTSVSQEAAHPRQQALGFRQPQHRKRSFNQEAVQPVARPARRLTPAATAAGPAAPRATTAATSIDAKAAERGQANGTVSAAKHALAGVGGSSSEPSPGGNTGAPDCGLSRGAHGGGAQLDSNGKQAAGPEGQLPAEAADTSVAVPPEYEDVKAWLQDLQMLQYMAVFVREEVDLSIVHALTAEELASVGITHKPHQATLLAAGQCLGQAQHGVRQQLQPSQQRGTAQLQGSGTALKGPQKASSPARPQPQQRQGWGPLQPPQQQQQQAAGAPRPRPARAGHQSLLQVWQANNLAAAAAEAGCDESPTGRLGRASHAGAQAPPVKAACAGSDAQPPEVVGQQQGMHLSSLGTRPMERALLAQLFPDDAAPGARHQRQQQGRQQAGSASTCDSYALLNPSTVGGLSRVPAGATLWAAAAECRQVAPGMEQRLAKRRADAGLAAAAPAPPLARGGTAYPQVEESRALKLLKLEALKQELTMHEETVSELKRVIRGMEAELGQE